MRTIIHLDLDAFFVAVERLDNPDLIGKPVLVGGRPDERGVVAAASYECRRFGVGSAMPTAQALRLCPQAILLSGHRERYSEMSRLVMRILADYTPDLEQISIDEAFLDVSGTEALFGPPAQLAQTIQCRIDDELKLSASLGVATNKLVAKIASDYAKPHGITVVPSGGEAAFLAPLPIRRLWGVGRVTAAELGRLGVETVADLTRFSREDLRARFGAHGDGLWLAARGIDDSPVAAERERKSLSREETFVKDIRDPVILRRELLRLSDDVAAGLRRHKVQARTVDIKLRYADFSTRSRQTTLPESTDAGPTIYAVAVTLFEAAWDRRPVRLLGVGGSGLCEPVRQLRLFEQAGEAPEATRAERQARLDDALDRIRARFGDDAIRRASLLDEPDQLWVSRAVDDD